MAQRPHDPNSVTILIPPVPPAHQKMDAQAEIVENPYRMTNGQIAVYLTALVTALQATPTGVSGVGEKPQPLKPHGS